MNPVAFWLAGMGFLQLGHALVRFLVGLSPEHPDLLDDGRIATAISLAAFTAHWATARGLKSASPRARGAARIAACLLVAGWASMTLVTLAWKAHGVRYSAAENTFTSAWLGIAWPRVLWHLGDLHLRGGGWPAPQIVAGILVVLLSAWMIGWLASAKTPPAVAPRGDEEPASELRRRLLAFRTQFSVPPKTRWLSRALALHLAFNIVLTIVAVIGQASSVTHRT